MKKKALLMLLIGAVALCLWGCAEDDEAAKTTTEQGETATQDETRTTQAPEAQRPVQPVPQGPGETARAPGAAVDALAQQRSEYVQGAEQILSNMEQKLTAFQQQAGAQQPESKQKIQELSKQVQTGLADARAAVEKMKTATGTQLKDAKVAADQAIRDAEASFKNLQSFMDTQVTQAQ